MQDIDEEAHVIFRRAKPDDKVFFKLDEDERPKFLVPDNDCENGINENLLFVIPIFDIHRENFFYSLKLERSLRKSICNSFVEEGIEARGALSPSKVTSEDAEKDLKEIEMFPVKTVDISEDLPITRKSELVTPKGTSISTHAFDTPDMDYNLVLMIQNLRKAMTLISL